MSPDEAPYDRNVIDGCLVCREVAGELELPGGLLWDDEQAIAFHVMPTDENPRPYLGHCMVVTRRHVDHLGDLTEAEVESVARASRALASGLRDEGAERVHVAVIGWEANIPSAPVPALSRCAGGHAVDVGR